MKTIKRSIRTVALVATMILTVSCKDANKNEAPSSASNEVMQENVQK